MLFPLVDLLRGFAALSVLVYHLIGHWEWEDFPGIGPLAWFHEGWMAVDLFFVVSGFVIGLSAFRGIDAHGGGFRRGFLRKRLARIVPLHYLALAAWLVAVEPGLWRQDGLWANLGAHLLFVHNLFLPYAGTINGPNWSLATEMQFYLLVLLAAPWLRQASPWRIALVFCCVAWAWRWGAHALTMPGPMGRAYFAQTQLPGMLDEFAIGLLLARFVRGPAGQAFLESIRTQARLRGGLVALVVLCWWALFTVLQGVDFWQEPAMAVFFRTALAGCTALALVLLCGWPLPRHGGWLAAPLYLGKVSYGIYLWHLPVLFLLGRWFELQPWQALLAALPTTIGLAALTWHGFEQPLLRRWGTAAGKASASTRPAPAAGDPEPAPVAR